MTIMEPLNTKDELFIITLDEHFFLILNRIFLRNDLTEEKRHQFFIEKIDFLLRE